MSSNIHFEVASNQLRQDLSQIVDNFTLLDILSKEEQDLVLETKIDSIKKTNEERMRRHQEIEADKRQASREGSTISTPSSLMSQTPPDQAMNSPIQQSASPSIDSGHVSPASSIEKHREDGGGGWDEAKPGWKDVKEEERRLGSGRSKQRQDASQKDPSTMKTRTETIEIDLHTVGTGLGFGVMNFPGIGVTVKTILTDGVAGRDGRLHSGDLLLQINDINVENKGLNDVYDILKQCQGDVRLVVSREIMEVSRGPAAQRRDGQRYTPPKDAPRPKKEALVVTFQNDRMEREQKVKRKVVMRGGNKEDIMITVEGDQGRPLGRGSVGGRGRGRTVRMNRDEVKRKEFEEKRRENLDRVDAEIAAMREALENEKAAGTVNPPSRSVYSFLDDPSRYGADPSRYGADPQQQRPPARGNRHDGGRRNQRIQGGQDADNAADGAGRRRDQRRRGGSQLGQRGPYPDIETTVTMSGKERQEYEKWKREREKIDQERIRRHQQAAAGHQQAAAGHQQAAAGHQQAVAGHQQATTGHQQAAAGHQQMGWGKQEEKDWDADIKTNEDQAGQREMRIGHWDASTEQRVEKRTGGSHFQHDDRVGDQRSQHSSRIGSGRFSQDGNQRGRGGGRDFYRGGQGQDRGRRGHGGSNRGSRPGRGQTPSDRELSYTDIRTLPEYTDVNPAQVSEKSFQESPIGQWQPTRESSNPGESDGRIAAQELTDNTQSLHIGPLPSPSAGSGCKSPFSPLSPFTPTGHTFLVDWATESEARGAERFAFDSDLVYNNSNTDQGS